MPMERKVTRNLVDKKKEKECVRYALVIIFDEFIPMNAANLESSGGLFIATRKSSA